MSKLALQECHGRHRFADISPSQLPREAEARLEIFELGWSNQTPACTMMGIGSAMGHRPVA
jgi:hypothetical protein